MSGQHTPGPWIGKDDTGRFNSDHEWSAEHESATSSTSAPIWANGKVVALVVSASKRLSFDDSELEANARLIAAAPAMLAELKKARAALKEQLEVHIQSCTNRVTGLVENDEDRLSIEPDQDMLDGIDRVIDQAEGRT